MPTLISGQSYTATEIAAVFEEAYLYAYPLILLEHVKRMATNTEYPTDTKAPINQLFHARELLTPEVRSLTRANVDTVYSQAYVDLKAEPIIVHKPATDRYCSVQLFDGYSNTPEILGTGALGGSEEHDYALVGPDWTGELPSGVLAVPVQTNFVWLLIRTKLFGPEDIENVYAIQNLMDLRPLSAFGKDYPQPKGEYRADYDYVALEKVAALSLQEYFELFNTLAVDNPAALEDEPALQRFAPLGIGAGLTFSFDAFDATVQKSVAHLPHLLGLEFSTKHAKVAVSNGWMFLDGSVGHFGTDYTFRAIVAFGGFANPVSMAVYPSMSMAGPGQPLAGDVNYVMHFDRGMLPPHNKDGWWSLTAYSKEGYVIANELDRYNVSDLNDLVENEDGSIDLYIQHKNPGPEKQANWLPVCEGIFSITMRIYLPTESVLDFSWELPPLEEFDQ